MIRLSQSKPKKKASAADTELQQNLAALQTLQSLQQANPAPSVEPRPKITVDVSGVDPSKIPTEPKQALTFEQLTYLMKNPRNIREANAIIAFSSRSVLEDRSMTSDQKAKEVLQITQEMDAYLKENPKLPQDGPVFDGFLVR